MQNRKPKHFVWEDENVPKFSSSIKKNQSFPVFLEKLQILIDGNQDRNQMLEK